MSGSADVEESEILDTVVVGAGVSGLCAAQALQRAHGDVVRSFLVTEARGQVGGVISTVTDGQYIWEEGPNAFAPDDAMLQAVVDASVADQMFVSDPNAPTFIYWDGSLCPTPTADDPLSGITFKLLTWSGKMRALLGAFGLAKSGPPPAKEESVEAFVRRVLGAEVYERIIEPLCSNVFAADASKLSMSAVFGPLTALEARGRGSLVGGAIVQLLESRRNPPPPRDARLPPKPQAGSVASFREGMKILPDAMASSLEGCIRCNWRLEGITKSSGVFTLQYSTPEGKSTLRARSILLTAPSYAAAELIANASADVDACADAANALQAIEYPPVAAVTIAYPESAIRRERRAEDGTLPGFGQIHPRGQGITTLGTIYSSSLFPDRAPPGEVLMLCYIGGATNYGILDQSDDEIYDQVDADLRVALLEPDAPPPVKVGLRVWRKSFPQLNVGHAALLHRATAGIAHAGLQGLVLGGNYVSGVSLGKCADGGYQAAREVADYLRSLE